MLFSKLLLQSKMSEPRISRFLLLIGVLTFTNVIASDVTLRFTRGRWVYSEFKNLTKVSTIFCYHFSNMLIWSMVNRHFCKTYFGGLAILWQLLHRVVIKNSQLNTRRVEYFKALLRKKTQMGRRTNRHKRQWTTTTTKTPVTRWANIASFSQLYALLTSPNPRSKCSVSFFPNFTKRDPPDVTKSQWKIAWLCFSCRKVLDNNNSNSDNDENYNLEYLTSREVAR